MVKFKSVESLIALRTNRKQVSESLSTTQTRDISSRLGIKPHKFKKKGDYCWEVDNKDQKEEIPGQLDLMEKEDND